MKKRDIETREDVIQLVDSFYDKVRENAILGYIFDDVAKVDWSHHLPKMYSFWSSILLGEKSYDGNPMQIHVKLGKQTTMSDVEFSEWIRVFSENVDAQFEGEKAEEAKIRGANIARLMLFNVERG
ncbi:group III truncated hemoglobin [Chryseobacterium sp.]|uniref:group III truncated hemoglobin n=1 Tax=Chryseobacterium sp. TaxID=1871047 RepID=UPI0025C6010B|nr:group III truncated hemoglobin [Chryseobacterium sp.]